MKKRRLLLLGSLGLIAGIVLASGAVTRSTGPAEGVSIHGSASTQPSGKYFRIGTFNIDGGVGFDDRLDLDRTAKALQHLNFIGMNEVHGSFGGNQAEALSAKLRLPYLLVPAEIQWWHESFGNAIFTDLPVERWQRVVLPNELFKARRNYLLTDVKYNGNTVHFLTTHTDWKSGGAEQLKIVSDVFLHLPEPAVLMGDLNAPGHDPQIQNLLKTAGVEEAIDQIMGDMPNRVDWIFLRGLKTIDAGVVDTGASDHPAFWAQVVINESPSRTPLPRLP
jgi:endonuclease/exonuclease/phosphatase family metal-dependent hydrolase